MTVASNPVFVAIDTPDQAMARALAIALVPHVGGIKIGKEFFTSLGPAAVRDTVGDAALFLDLKFHDIPNTVAGAVRAAVGLQPRLLTIHAGGGRAMMEAAAQAAEEAAGAVGCPRPKVVAVTVLTSLSDRDMQDVGFTGSADEMVLRLAQLAQDSGIDGVVCSPREIEAIRKVCGDEFHLVVPGIRPAGSDAGDQKRVMTPRQALDAGASVLVIGRPITGAADPVAAAQEIKHDLGLYELDSE
ncbi:MAG: orotidine-5'-phosphate decarboxylase [Pseudomonadota bacterium]